MKNSKKGISLIVLIITIIVIVILATAILVSVISNNPISEANKARYESDRDNMQAVFTNTVGKIMAENQGVVNVTAGQINTETKDVNEATGEVAYTVDNATVAENASGTIKFDKGTNDATTYYTGKKLPIYAAGETKWYVDSEGVLSLEVAGVKYGSIEVEKLTYTSLGNYQHYLSDGTVESHDTESGTCSKCGETVLETGIYSEDNIKTKDFWELVYNFDTEPPVGEENQGMLHPSKSYVYLYSNGILSTHYGTGPGDVNNLSGKLVLGNSIVEIGYEAFMECVNLTSVILPENLEIIKDFTFGMCSNLKTISISSNVTNIGTAAFVACEKLTDINYSGTKEQWNKISLYEGTNSSGDWDWNYYCPEITVHCIDGDIIIPANQ